LLKNLKIKIMALFYNDPNIDDQYEKQMRRKGAGAAGAGALAGAGTGAAIGTMIMPGIGTGIGAGVGALAGGVAGVLSSKQRRYTEALAKSQIKKGQEAEKNLVRPTYERPGEITQDLNIKRGMAEEGLSQQAKDYNRMMMDRNVAYSLQQLEGRKAGLAGIGALQQGLQDNAMRLSMEDETARRANTLAYTQSLQNAAQYSDKEFEINKMQPFELALQRAMALQGAGLQNLNTAYGQRGKAAMRYVGMLQGLGQQVGGAGMMPQGGGAQTSNFLSQGQVSPGNAAALAQIAQMGGMAACWVAEELYGVDDERTHLARYYVLNTDNWFNRLYTKRGKSWAKFIKKYPFLKPIVQPIWDNMYIKGALMIKFD
jgi:hypothetical protein